MADELVRIKLRKGYAGKRRGSVYECDPVRAEWLMENGYGKPEDEDHDLVDLEVGDDIEELEDE